MLLARPMKASVNMQVTQNSVIRIELRYATLKDAYLSHYEVLVQTLFEKRGQEDECSSEVHS